MKVTWLKIAIQKIQRKNVKQGFGDWSSTPTAKIIFGCCNVEIYPFTPLHGEQ